MKEELYKISYTYDFWGTTMIAPITDIISSFQCDCGYCALFQDKKALIEVFCLTVDFLLNTRNLHSQKLMDKSPRYWANAGSVRLFRLLGNVDEQPWIVKF